jgi:hypothetical protein
MSWKDYEELQEVLDNFKEKTVIVSRLFPDGFPLSLEGLNTVEKEEAYRAFCEAWQALQAFVTKHPLLGAS